MTTTDRELATRWVSLLLRLAGGVMAFAFLAMLMPTAWMASTHRWLGLGEFPDRPVVEYLARSISALYGFHGVLLLIVAGDPVHYRALVDYVAIMNVAFGLIVFAIDLEAGMPLFWTAAEGPPIAVFGVLLGVLSRRSGR